MHSYMNMRAGCWFAARKLPCTSFANDSLCKCASNMPFRSPWTAVAVLSPSQPGIIPSEGSIVIELPVSVTGKLFVDWVNEIYRMLQRMVSENT